MVKLQGGLLVVLALAATIAPGAQARAPRDFVGITSEDAYAGSAGYRAANLTAQRSLRIRLTRQTFDWSAIERTKGSYDLSYTDDYVAAEAAHGMRVMPILFRAPRFYRRSHGRDACPPKSNTPMARFARVLVRRYGPKGSLWRARPSVPKVPIRSWEIWNEPSLPTYWCGRPRARSYVKMLKTVGRGIKKSDRRAEIVTAGLPNSFIHRAVRLTRYIKQMYQAKAGRYFTTLAINSYARNSKDLARLLRTIRKRMNRSHDRRAKIWITEIGWADRGPRQRFVVGAKGQASRISTSVSYIRRARHRLGLRGFIYYSWRDSPPYAPRNKDMWGLHTGLLTRSGAHKRAYRAFRTAVRRIR